MAILVGAGIMGEGPLSLLYVLNETLKSSVQGSIGVMKMGICEEANYRLQLARKDAKEMDNPRVGEKC